MSGSEELPNSRDIYAIYQVMFRQPFHLRRKSVIFSAVLAGEPWSWKVLGITQAALEALSKTDYQYVGRTICRAHIVNRIDTANAIFNIPRPLSYPRLFRILVKTGITIITLKSENKFAAQLPYFPLDPERRLFKNQLISFSYGRTERNALRELHLRFKSGKAKLVRPAGKPPVNVAPYQIARKFEPVPNADGKRVIVGTIGESKYLLDAGDGEIISELKSGRDLAQQAAAVNRTLVPRRLASKHAVKSLVRRWNQAKDMKHQWTEAEDIAVLALTKKYGLTGWKNDPLATILISGRGVSGNSLQMALGNFIALMGLPGGLENWSKRQKRSFQKHGNLSAGELYELAQKELGKP